MSDDFYDERDYWWNLMTEETNTKKSKTTFIHTGDGNNMGKEKFKNKEGSDWDYDTYGHGG